jgi:hypothetical protein
VDGIQQFQSVRLSAAQASTDAASAGTLRHSQVTPTPERTLDAWHRIFGHLSLPAVKQLVDKHMVTEMKISPGSHDIEKCNICTQAKQHVEPFPKEAQREFTEIGGMTFTDVWGAACTRGIHGERYYISFTDGAKRHRKVALMKKKSEADTEVTNYIEFILTQFGKR